MNITHGLRRALQVNSCATTASDATRDVSGQVFGTRMNEIYLFSSPRPIPSQHIRKRVYSRVNLRSPARLASVANGSL
jgi:hypothetical protein